MYGIASNSISEPVHLSVNGHQTTAMAFYQRTGSKRRDFETHLLARGVDLLAGDNEVRLSPIR